MEIGTTAIIIEAVFITGFFAFALWRWATHDKRNGRKAYLSAVEAETPRELPRRGKFWDIPGRKT